MFLQHVHPLHVNRTKATAHPDLWIGILQLPLTPLSLWTRPLKGRATLPMLWLCPLPQNGTRLTLCILEKTYGDYEQNAGLRFLEFQSRIERERDNTDTATRRPSQFRCEILRGKWTSGGTRATGRKSLIQGKKLRREAHLRKRLRLRAILSHPKISTITLAATTMGYSKVFCWKIWKQKTALFR